MVHGVKKNSIRWNYFVECFYDQDSLLKYIDDKIIDIKPTDVPENISEKVPGKI